MFIFIIRRLDLCLVIITEWYFGGVLIVFSIVSFFLFLIINLVDTYKLLQLGNERDREEKRLKEQNLSKNG